MILNSYLPGFFAGLLFFLLSEHAPWGLDFPSDNRVEDWLVWIRSWMDQVGVLLAFVLSGCMCGIRVRDKEISAAVLLWMAAGSSMHHAPPEGMAMLGVTLIWWVLLGGSGELYGGVKGAFGVHLVCLSSPIATIGAAPMALHVAYDRLGDRRQTIAFFLILLILFGFLWKIDPISGHRLAYVWSELLSLEQRFLNSWMNLFGALALDPVFLMAVPGCLYLGRLGLPPVLRGNLMLCFVIALATTLISDVQILIPFAPVFALAVGSFLDREIQGRLMWLGVILGSILAALHHDSFQSSSLALVKPWWLELGAPEWLAYIPQGAVLGLAFFLIFRALGRISGVQAKLSRGGACAAMAALTVLAVRWSAGFG